MTAHEAAQRLDLALYVAGERVDRVDGERLDVRYPYDGALVGTVAQATPELLEQALARTRPAERTRFERSAILRDAQRLLGERADEFSDLIRRESGLCVRETRYEVGRTLDVLRAAEHEALRDDGRVFSGDVSPQGKQRKIFTLREPVRLAVAITPFNHPLNQVAHKLAPAVAVGAPVILKPSEKTPLSAIRFVELLLEAGLPPETSSVLLGPIDTIVEPLVRDPRVESVSFTGSVAVGKRIAQIAGYKKLCLELGGNSPLIVLADCDLDLAVRLAAEGSFRNSGQRCTAVKRILVEEPVRERFTDKLVGAAARYRCGDPADPDTRVGTVIDEAAAVELERNVLEAVADGAKVLFGGSRDGAVFEPTVIADVPRTARMVREEAFGPLAPIVAIRDLDDAITLANATPYGLSTGIVTNHLGKALRAVREIRTGTVNVNEVPGYRIESTPFGGVKDSGLGVKEGVVEAMRFLTNLKTFSLPW